MGVRFSGVILLAAALAVGCGVLDKGTTPVEVADALAETGLASSDAIDTTLSCDWEGVACEPDKKTNRRAILFSFSAGTAGEQVSGVGFVCSLDSSEFRECKPPLILKKLSDQRHVFLVSAMDASGTLVDDSPAKFVWTVDSTPPDTVFSAVPRRFTNEKSAFFGMKSNEEGTTFECSLDRQTFAACESPLILPDLAEGDHRFDVRALDGAGNADPTPASHTWTVDLVPPDTVITADQPPATRSFSVQFTLSTAAPREASGEVTFNCYLNGAPLGFCPPDLNLSQLLEGDHTLSASAADPAGNKDPTPAVYAWKVDRTPPVTTIKKSPSTLSELASATFEFECSETSCIFECSLDGAMASVCPGVAEYTDLLSGDHSLEVSAFDQAGNKETVPVAHAWTVDRLPPENPTALNVVADSPGTSVLSWIDNSSDESGFIVQRRTLTGNYEDVASLAANTTSYTNTGLVPGTAYVYRVQAIDALGNISASPEASATQPLDVSNPVFPGLTGLIPISETSAKLAWVIASDDVSSAADIGYDICRTATSSGCINSFTANIVQILPDPNNPNPACSPGPTACEFTVTGLPPGGAAFFIVRARDQGGNRDSNFVEKRWAFLSGVQSVDSGGEHTCARMNDGTIKCWGGNRLGELGNGGSEDRFQADDVQGINTATAAGAGGHHACAVLTDSTLRCWGENVDGRIGDATTLHRFSPVFVPGLPAIVSVAAGGHHTCALAGDGSVRCWGRNGEGQVGDGSSANRLSAVAVSTLTNVAQVAAGEHHSCALITGGTVQCWGDNGTGQLGDGTTVRKLVPVDVAGLASVVSISLGGWHSCALITGGSVKCWGRNIEGQIGDGTNVNRFGPVSVAGLSNASSLGMGLRRSCARLSDSTARCWGEDAAFTVTWGGTLNKQNSSAPVAVSALTNVTAVSAGDSHSCAVLADGTVKCWGSNSKGQTGRGFGTENEPKPVMLLP